MFAAASYVGKKIATKAIELATEFFREKLYEAFTHERTITVAVGFTKSTDVYYSGTYEDNGVEIAYDDNNPNGLLITFHNDGPISGCIEFKHRNCDWALRIAASNPLFGSNKARASYRTAYWDGGAYNCYDAWDAMDGWGETEGAANRPDSSGAYVWLDSYKANVYDNPSVIAFGVTPPDHCTSFHSDHTSNNATIV